MKNSYDWREAAELPDQDGPDDSVFFKDPPRVVCLCGSTRFADTFNRIAVQRTMAGEIVLRPEVVTYSAENDPQKVAPETKAMLDELHFRKIDLADEVFVINVGGYIGESTRNEIAYSHRTRKPVFYLEPTK